MKTKKHSLHILSIFLIGLLVGLCLRNYLEQPIHLNAQAIVVCEAFNDVNFHELPQVCQFIERDGYTVCYDARCKNPYYVIETLSTETLQGSEERFDHPFREDTDIPTHMRATLKDYKGSGYDRGHMAPAANCRKSVQRMAESFFLSNVCPQDAGMNRNYWAAFEKHVRTLAKQFRKVTVITGPLYMPQGVARDRFVHYRCIGDSDVAVPTHFFKVLLLDLGYEMEERAYILPNENIAPETPLTAFQVTVQKVEQVSGIIFF